MNTQRARRAVEKKTYGPCYSAAGLDTGLSRSSPRTDIAYVQGTFLASSRHVMSMKVDIVEMESCQVAFYSWL